MRTRLVSAAIAILVTAALVISLAGTVLAAGPGTKWYLCDSDQYFSPSNGIPHLQYIMSENVLSAEGTVPAIKEGEYVTWIADKAAPASTAFPADNWIVNLAIEDGDGMCIVQIGKWVPGGADGTFAFYCNEVLTFKGGGPDTVAQNLFDVYVGAFSLNEGERLACRITTVNRQTVLHSGSAPDAYGQSWIQVPGGEPPPPVPELPTVVLLGIGLVGVAGVMGLSVLRHRSAA